MRHRKKFNHLKRKRAHRLAMLSNMASSLIMHKRIHTTLAKAKALRPYVEPLITRSKNDSTHSRRIVFAHLQNKESVNELFREVATKVADRQGGYTRILKLGPRKGDSAEMAMMELVDYNETMLAEKEEERKSKRRTRRGGGRKKKSTPVAETSESTGQAQQAETEAPTETAEAEDVTEAETSTAEEPTEEPATEKGPAGESEQASAEEEQQDTEAKQDTNEEKEDNNTEEDKEDDKKE